MPMPQFPDKALTEVMVPVRPSVVRICRAPLIAMSFMRRGDRLGPGGASGPFFVILRDDDVAAALVVAPITK